VIIFDSPAVLAVADSAVLGTLCNAAILVVDVQRTRVGVVRSAKAALDQIGLPILGVLLTRLKDRRLGYHRYYLSGEDTRGHPRWLRGIADAWDRVAHRDPKTAASA
jgi:Mrp family chromosome partitioning ATPase